ncbi:prealbumin-like fold domain-containing protein [Puerhibacterium puerhi]|uniref:prealbumin-like fold domain-containing protein n=1 Tax=Puerhibacterium puerhi TaxID=2692623 RepID=UPI0013591236|nr:prealbumin-like fold domain-containing protein [Puerhibacterium puerhi]
MPPLTAAARRRPRIRVVVTALVAALILGLGLGLAAAPAQAAQAATVQAAGAPGAVPMVDVAQCAPGTLYSITSDGVVHLMTTGADGPAIVKAEQAARLTKTHAGAFNALAVSADGSAFYAAERWSGTERVGLFWRSFDAVRIVRTDASGSRTLVDDFRVASENTIAGAVDPRSGDYFLGVSLTDGVAVYRFAADGSNGRQVGTLSTDVGTNPNGDFAFDADGNLFFIASRSRTKVYTVPAAQLQRTGTAALTPSATSDPLSVSGAFNGIALSPDTYTFASTDTSVVTFDPNTMAEVSRFSRSGITDLASCQVPSTLTLQKNIANRVGATDQFTLEILRADGGTSLGTSTTSGSSTGLQADAVVGPVPALGGKTYRLRELAGNRSTNLARYDISLRCTETTSGRDVPVTRTSTAGEYTLVYPTAGATARGLDVDCTFTNSSGSYAVTKTADPASGTQVEPGQRVTYSVGVVATGVVNGVVLTDDLSDVLDDATFVAGSARLVVAGGAPVAVPDPSRGALTSPAFDLTDGQRATLTYAVDVRKDAWSARLRNVVTGRDAGGKAPTTCTTATPCATEHTTPEPGTYAVTKAADPAAGTTVEPGRQVTYTVTTTAADGPVRDVVLTDDLADVLDDATFVAGSARLTVAGGRPSAVPDPRGTTLTSPAFGLDAGQSATLTYAVQVRDDAWSATLRNVVTAVDGRGVPPTTCTDAAPCATEHSTPSRLQVEKVGEAVDGTWVPMAGSAWALRADADGTPGAVLTTPAVTPVDGQTGRFLATGLAAGTYWLEETKAPAGFSLLAQPVRFTIGADGAVTLADDDGGVVSVADDDGDGTWTLTVRDVPALELPETGGGGTRPYLTAGAGLLAVAAALALLTARHRRRT